MATTTVAANAPTPGKSLAGERGAGILDGLEDGDLEDFEFKELDRDGYAASPAAGLVYSSHDDEDDVDDSDSKPRSYHAGSRTAWADDGYDEGDVTPERLEQGSGLADEDDDRYTASVFRSRRRHIQEKHRWLDEGKSLNAQRDNLERDRKLHMFQTRNQDLRASALDAKNLQHRLDEDLATEARDLHARVVRYQRSVSAVKRRIEALTVDQQNLADADAIHVLSKKFDAVEAELESFKRDGRSRYNELDHQQAILSKDLRDFYERASTWDQGPAVDTAWRQAHFSTPAKRSSGRRSRKNLPGSRSTRATAERPAGLTAVEKKIAQLGGRSGGWNDRDHATFLRLLSRYQLRDAHPSADEDSSTLKRREDSMLACAIEKFPDIGGPEVAKHLEWYRTYSRLVEERRSLIKQWRRESSSKKTMVRTGSREAASPGSPGMVVSSPSSAAQEVGSASAQDRAKERRRLQAKKAAEDEKKRQQVAEWRAAKKRIKEEEEAARKKAIGAQRAKSRRDRQRRGEVKEQVALYRLQRESEKARQAAVRKVLATARGQISGPPTSSTALRRRHEQNMLKIRAAQERKRQQNMRRQRAEQRRRGITEAINNSVPYDANRATRHTVASAYSVLSTEKLDDHENQRQRRRAHETSVHSCTGAETSRGRGYTFSRASTLKVPKWRRVAGR